MEIQGLDYNTQREPLLMPEYGREIQKMVDFAVSIPSREERLLCAKTIVKMMETKVPQIRENANYQQTLWDHLFLMSGKQLDIDWPFDVTGAESIHAKPAPMQHPSTRIGLRHYGRLVEELFERLKRMPAGSIDNEKVADDLARFTDGIIQLDLNSFVFDQYVPTDEVPVKRGKKKK